MPRQNATREHKCCGSVGGCTEECYRKAFDPENLRRVAERVKQAGLTAPPDDEFGRAMMAKMGGNEAEYIRSLRRSFAQFGNKCAAMELGGLYHKGRGVPQSYPEAMEWYFQALQTTPG